MPSAVRSLPTPLSVNSADALVIGRYVLAAQLARGGIATVYLGTLHGDSGFKRVVAIKRLHAQFRTDGDIGTMFLDEARLASRVRHPNVVHGLDVVLHEDELFLVMEYIEGASLSQLSRSAGKVSEEIPIPIAVGIVAGVLHGLHAAHEAKDERGAPLGIIHRDVSPQNILVGTDGIGRVLDFGVAKAIGQAHVTRHGEIKGKLAYMAPEQLLGQELTPTADIFSAGIVLWELLTAHRLFYGANEGEIVRRLLEAPIPPPSSLNNAITPALDSVVLRALERDRERRFATAADMATALEEVVAPATPRRIGEWVRSIDKGPLAERAALVASVEAGTSDALVALSRSGSHVLPEPKQEDLASTLHGDAVPFAKKSRAPFVVLGVVLVALTAFGIHRATRQDESVSSDSASSAQVAAPALSLPTSSASTVETSAPSATASASASASAPPPSATTAKPGAAPVRAGPTTPTRKSAPRASAGSIYTRD